MKCLIASFCVLFATYASAETLRFAVMGDAGRVNNNTEAARASMQRQGIYDLILPGDNLYESDYETVWNPWSKDGFHFTLPAIGNHNGGYKQEIRFFGMPGAYYARTFANSVKFVVLNSDDVSTAKEQAQFLEKELSAASEPFVFLVYHHPTYTLSHFHKWEEKRDFQLAIRPLIWKYRQKITALLVGHDHLALLAHIDDLPVIVSGAAAEARKDTPVNGEQDGRNVKTDWFFDGQYHWAALDIDTEDTTVTLKFVRSLDDAVTCSALIATGRPANLDKNCK